MIMSHFFRELTFSFHVVLFMFTLNRVVVIHTYIANALFSPQVLDRWDLHCLETATVASKQWQSAEQKYVCTVQVKIKVMLRIRSTLVVLSVTCTIRVVPL